MNPATLDVKSMVGRNYSGGAEEKFLKLAKYAAAHIAAWLTMEQVGGCPMAMAWQCGRARWYGMA